MYTLLQKAVGYFSGAEADSGLESNVCERPKLEDFLSGSFFESERFEGLVTSISNRDVVVNNDIYFSIPLSHSRCKFKVGDSVQGVAERKNKHEAWRAVSLSLRVHKEGWDTDHPVLSGEAISCRDLDAGIPGILKNDLFSARTTKQNLPTAASTPLKQSCEVEDEKLKTIVGKVQAVHGDTVTLNENRYFSLTKATSSFELLEGDWIVCTVADEHATDDLNQRVEHLPGFVNVSSIEPLRRKKIRGSVTHCYASHCVINSEVFCSNQSAKELSLRIGDNLTVEVIESNQGNFGWRAVSLSFVTPHTIKELRSSILNLSTYKGLEGDMKTADLFEDKHDIVISRSLRFPEVMLGCQSHLNVFVKNTGKQNQSLCRVYFVSTSQECQFSVVSESPEDQVNGIAATIMPEASFIIKLRCTAKLLGLFKQLCIFDFGSFRIGRYASVSVGDHHIMTMVPSKLYVRRDRRSNSPIQIGDARVVKGEKPFKAPAFVPVSLPAYQIPLDLWTAIENGDSIIHRAPFLLAPITPENHQEKFTLLLHLEEIEMGIQMRQFDMMRTTFSTHGEYLSLTVPGLAEKRPSLMIGDTVIASSPCDTADTEYEGYIHEVLNTQILLKFHPSFHNQYRGEDYAVRFNFNRTPLRRCHFALKFSMEQHGLDVLFPNKLKMQLPQIAYVDLEAESPNHKDESSVCHQPQNSVCNQKSTLYAKKSCVESEERKESSLITVNNDNGFSSGLRICVVDEAKKINLVNNVNHTSQNKMNPDVKHLPKNSTITNGDFHDSEKQLEIDVKSTCKKLDEIIENSAKIEIPNSKKFEIFGGEYKCKNNFAEDGTNEDCSRFRLKYDKNSILSASSTVGQRGSSVTPPRIPVVTRLFGVPSSGSSTNSSMCCSDDETKSNCDVESSSKPKKGGSDKNHSRISNETDIDGIVKELKFRSSSTEKGFSANSNNVRPILDNTVQISRNSLNESKNQAEICRDVVTSRDNSLNESKNQAEICRDVVTSRDHSHYEKNGGVSEDKPLVNPSQISPSMMPSVSGVSENVGSIKHRCSNAVQNEMHTELTSKTTSKQKENERGSSESNDHESSYCTPVLPVLSSNRRKIKDEVPVLRWYNKELNLEQKLAVRRILEGSTRPLPYVIYGPPGTGKTVTLVEAVMQIFTLVHHSRILVVTPSNSAADLVTERLLLYGRLKIADLVRLNAYQRKEDSVPENIQAYCCNGDQLTVRVHQRVIVTTASTSGLLYTLSLHNGHFSHVFVDEAGQLTEPECLVALGLVNSASGQVVLAGDPQQLGPVVQSKLGKKCGLQESLLHRLCGSVLYQAEEKSKSSAWIYEPRLVTQLVKNYRSHPDVFAIPSKLFYHDSLQAYSSKEVKEKLLSWDELPNASCPLLFHGLVSENLQEGDSPSWFNPMEAFQVVRYAKSLISFGLNADDIGIITPYRKQVQKIRKLLTIFGIAEGIKVGTVEEFQGQERTAVIISTVRSSEEMLKVDIQHSLGFVKCRRRFNVAVTRAQSLLVVIGNPFLLLLDDCWLDFISFCIQKGAYRGPELQLSEE